jgi:5'-methylthioadenosine phosphorylase
MSQVKIGVIGGSGLYEMDGLEGVREEKVATPFGDPSDSFMVGTLGGIEMVFLPRHGRGHVVTPSEINYRANIWGMKSLGVTHIISISACGSLQEEIQPGQIVIIDQFIDRTRGREATFFGNGCVGHVAFADPICDVLADTLYETALELKVPVHQGGTYICMEGPAFSTRAESHLYRSWGANVIGMTNLTEAKLAREAEIAFGTLALATDYDCWREADSDVDITDIMRIMNQNVHNAKAIVAAAVKNIKPDFSCKCFSAAEFAVITAKEKISEQAKKDLDIIIGKYL